MAPHTAPCPNSASLQKQLEQELVNLYREHASELSRYAASFSQRQDAARDAVQDIFLRYFIERRYGRQIENPRAWLYHVLRNYFHDHGTPANPPAHSAPRTAPAR